MMIWFRINLYDFVIVERRLMEKNKLVSVVKEELFHNFRIFKYTAIYRIIKVKTRKTQHGELSRAA